MRKWFALILVLLFAFLASAGTVAKYRDVNNTTIYSILPNCRANTADTCGLIPLANAKHFSFTFSGNRAIAKKDTAIVDSGFFVRLYIANANSSTNMITLSTADSSIQLFGDDTLNARVNRSKGLTLDAGAYLGVVVRRWDTNADTLDFKSAGGVRDSLGMTINLVK